MTRGERLTQTSLEPTGGGSSREKFCSGKGIYFATAPEPILFSEYGRTLSRAYGRKNVLLFRIPPVGVLGTGVFGECYKTLKHKNLAIDLNKAFEALRGPWICSGEKVKEQLGVAISPDLESKFRRVALWYENQGLV